MCRLEIVKDLKVPELLEVLLKLQAKMGNSPRVIGTEE